MRFSIIRSLPFDLRRAKVDTLRVPARVGRLLAPHGVLFADGSAPQPNADCPFLNMASVLKCSRVGRHAAKAYFCEVRVFYGNYRYVSFVERRNEKVREDARTGCLA
jgi:hypothetical protein